MKIILDTHIFLWDIISDVANEVYLSVASIWECIIKEQIKKLVFPSPASQYLISERVIHNIFSMPIDEESLGYLSGIPDLHRDPFDRIILCQALRNGCKIITDDQIFKRYPYPIFI